MGTAEAVVGIVAFPSTGWRTVFQAAADEETLNRAALGRLADRYREPCLSFLQSRWKRQRVEAEDIYHEFLENKVLEKNLLSRADPKRGRFRSFLVASLHRFTINRLESESAQKRGGGQEHVDADLADEPHASGTDESLLFDHAWAVSVLDESALRFERNCDLRGASDRYRVFEGRALREVQGLAPMSLEDLATELSISKEKVSNLLASAKRSFLAVVRQVISEFGYEPDEIDEELNYLIECLSRGPR